MQKDKNNPCPTTFPFIQISITFVIIFLQREGDKTSFFMSLENQKSFSFSKKLVFPMDKKIMVALNGPNLIQNISSFSYLSKTKLVG